MNATALPLLIGAFLLVLLSMMVAVRPNGRRPSGRN